MRDGEGATNYKTCDTRRTIAKRPSAGDIPGGEPTTRSFAGTGTGARGLASLMGLGV